MSEIVRERTIRWEDPMLVAAESRTSAGIDALRAAIEGRVPPPPIAVLMDIRLVFVEENHAIFEGTPAEYHYNPIGIVHGGFALTLMDSALGCAVHSGLPAGVGYTSTDVQVRFIRPITATTGVVRCEARVVHSGRSTAVAQATLVDGAGKLLATGTTACAIFRG